MTPPIAGDTSERVLVLAPTGRDADLAAAVLRKVRLEVAVCPDLPSVLAELERGAGALILAQEALGPEGAERLARWAAHQPPWSDLPVVAVTSASAALEAGAALDRLGRLGNVTVLERPLRRTSLTTVALAAIRARRRQYAAREVLLSLEQAVSARDQFLAMLGHELRNPLAAITLALQVVEQRGAATQKELDVVRRQSRQLGRIVDDLLDVARATSGKISIHRVPVDLAALVARGMETFQPQAAKLGITISWAPPLTPVTVLGDPVRLEQVLANLVGNALKYTPRGGNVALALGRDGGEGVLSVRDDGVGIAPDQLHRVFDTFVQVETTLDRSLGGLGLGLTLAKSLVSMHGGTIEARSAGIDQGSEFVVRLPAVESDAARPPPSAPPAPERSRRVLVVEDAEDNRTMLKAVLEQLGHEVLVCADGATGVDRAIQDAPEVVVVDIGLPGLDGYEVARRIRAARGRRALLVALTGYGQPEDRRRALEAGFDVHLTKPVEMETLMRILRRGAA